MNSSTAKQTQLYHLFEQTVDQYGNNIALICDNALMSYQELEVEANRLAHCLRSRNVGSASIVGLIIERSMHCYVALLAVLKTGAAYVPIEVDYPDERINYILEDLSFNLVLTTTSQYQRKSILWPTTIILDELATELMQYPTTRIDVAQAKSQDLCYVIYTSGSTGKPKGVEVPHASICHYVQTASKIYDMQPADRVYQGFSLAFDASLEELWMAFANGATLVACTEKEVRSGLGLIAFLQQHQITVWSTVPTLLASLQGELPQLRLLILGGEVCPQALVQRFSRPGLRIFNTYGPTEATVIATYEECFPDAEITIGLPLPGYEVVILNENLAEVAMDEEGELCIGGLALAHGYVNRPEQTLEKFILYENRRFYRTGDLAARTRDGKIRYAGRIDDQIKLRGFRIELHEIEHALLDYPGVKQAVVIPHPTEAILIAYGLHEQGTVIDPSQVQQFLRGRLPDYMIPAHIEWIESFPVLPSGKVNRKALPLPQMKPSESIYKSPESELGQTIAQLWREIFNREHISVDAHFFYDLGGHSLLAAKMVSELRKVAQCQQMSVLDLYKYPTIAQLEQQFQSKNTASREPEERYHAPQWQYMLCGMGQFFGCLFQYAVGTFQLLAVILCYSWITANYSIISREAQFAFLLLFLTTPVLSLLFTVGMKWLLLGRVKPGKYPLWGWFYYRWWLVQRLQKNLFLAKFLVGSPLATLYQRLLGAKIGKNAYIGTMQIATPDLLTIGDNSSIGMDSRLYGYIVENGWLKIGTINIGNNCYLGARTVMGINTAMADHCVLDDMSMLAADTSIAAQSYYSGSPAVQGNLPTDHVTRHPVDCEKPTRVDNAIFGFLHYLGVVFITLMFYLCLLPGLSLVTHYYDQSSYLKTMFIAIPLGAILFLALHYLGIILSKKLVLSKMKPGQYPIKSFYYLRYWIISKMLDGDEVSILADTLFLPVFLRFLGAKLGKGVEMGEAPHIIPDLVTIEAGGFTASSVALAWPMVFGGTMFCAPVSIGRKGFVGNVSMLPAGKKIGDGTLIGCLSLPPAGNLALEANSAWLGSPAVYLPKRELFTGFSDQETFNPTRKLFLLRLSIEFFRILLPTTLSLIVLFNLLYVLDYCLNHYSWKIAAMTLPVAELGLTVTMVGLLSCLKWVLLGRLKPLTKPIWDPFIWKNDIVEYSYNYYTNPHLTNKLLGTPFALWIHRSLGTKAGKRVFTDSAEFSEFDLITIEDEVCINAETILQTHLYEDRFFKVAQVHIQAGCSIGVGSIVLYSTKLESNSTLGSLSLLMKGECLAAGTSWEGIPAQTIKTPVRLAAETAGMTSKIEDEGALAELL